MIKDTKPIWFIRIGTAFQLAGDVITQTALRPEDDIVTGQISLTRDGLLTTKKYYTWDGPSVPEFVPMNERTLNAMLRGSLIHDCLYQLHREGLLFNRAAADNELRRLCIEDGLPEEEAESVWRAVQMWGAQHCDPGKAKAPVCAP